MNSTSSRVQDLFVADKVSDVAHLLLSDTVRPQALSDRANETDSTTSASNVTVISSNDGKNVSHARGVIIFGAVPNKIGIFASAADGREKTILAFRLDISSFISSS